jgi:two-component system, NtrC family, response regulator HydG
MRARLIYQDCEDKTVTVELTGEVTATIGRSRDNTVVLRDEHASRVHARIQFDRGQWLVSDFGLNGTRLNGVRVEQQSPLRHGDEVRVGDTRMRFALLDPSHSGPITKRHILPPPADPPPSTRLQHDDLSVLCNFMAAAMREQDTHRLLRQGLDVVLHQTSACLVGYLSDDPNDPVTKMVTPETATVDVQLSKQLIKRVQRDNKAVWLCSDLADTRTDSTAHFSDALCLPLKAAAGQSMGTLHVYRLEGYFSERDLRFCEAISVYLANALHMHRAQTTLRAENSRLRGRADATEDMVGDSAAMRELRDVIARVAPRAATVLVRGESGAGKELVAVAMHRHSDRATGPLVIVNCAAIPANLMESELFGYRKGAFSGADRDHSGYFMQADEGTIFLDEIAELSADCQAKLLRVLDGRPFRQVGGSEDIRVNVRIVAATNREIEAEIKAGKFREDLYFRLKVVTLDVPPLREHADDIRYLVQYFLDKFSAEHRRQYRITPAAVERLQKHPWPGNVRQLRTVLESAAVMATVELLDVGDLRLDHEVGDGSDLPIDLDQLEAWAVRKALKRVNGNKTKAAQLLGIGRDALYSKIEKYGLAGDATQDE